MCATAYPEANEESGPRLCHWTNDQSGRRTHRKHLSMSRQTTVLWPAHTDKPVELSELHKSGSAEDNRWRACCQDLIGLHGVGTEGNKEGGGVTKELRAGRKETLFVSPQRKVE